jgi:hypothetical protein
VVSCQAGADICNASLHRRQSLLLVLHGAEPPCLKSSLHGAGLLKDHCATQHASVLHENMLRHLTKLVLPLLSPDLSPRLCHVTYPVLISLARWHPIPNFVCWSDYCDY